MIYSRPGAVAYATTYWNRVCHDNYIALEPESDFAEKKKGHRPFIKVEPDTVFITAKNSKNKNNPNKVMEYAKRPQKKPEEYISFDDLNDCTHFVSCCLGKGGGLLITPQVKDGPFGKLGVPVLIDYLKTKNWIKQTGTPEAIMVADLEKAKEIMLTLEKGDIVAYLDGKGLFHHLALYLGDNKIACHTTSQWQSLWNFNRYTRWIFYRVTA